ncbi:hypothetical protein AW736_08000 [Termitidicoccus mucosus]|uniref:Uncharacterized protein n=1 Tax=Termitidicoccus mucosus TaxID=1184151 RepID=A0A178IKJ7_9BACT|nr:hypothetical protein AW736_08000 [Opitutaceae bacterium TSB47]
MKILLCILFVVPVSAAMLDQPVERLRFESAALPDALRSLGRATHTTILVDSDIIGKVTVEVGGGTLRDALAALTVPYDYFFEEQGTAIAVRQRKTVLYAIDYPQLTRSGFGSASITLGGMNGGYDTSQNLHAQSTYPNRSNQSMDAASDATQVSISQENPNTFWAGLEAELRTMLGEKDSLVLNRFSGIAQVTAPLSRHDVIRAFIELVNRRISRQVEIEARLVEVTLRDEQKLGVDWELATSALGDLRLDASAPLAVTGVGGSVFGNSSFAANLGLGKATAIIQALKQQGDVTTVAQPRLRALNNQTAFIKVGEDRPFFRLQQSTTYQQAGTTVPYNQTQETFSISTITIGTILAVTPQVDNDGVITLDVLPAITRLQSIVTSPDGKQTAPVTEVKQASTIVRLRNGETAVIGGLISEESGSSTRAVPVLSRVPLLGLAFRSQATLRNRTELVIFLTPHLIP